MSEQQMTFEGVPARCEYLGEVAQPHRGDPVVQACTLPPHDEGTPHRLDWVPMPSRGRAALTVIDGGGRL